jgi:hypothetical protein
VAYATGSPTTPAGGSPGSYISTERTRVKNYRKKITGLKITGRKKAGRKKPAAK